MRVKMLVADAGASGVKQAGHVYDVPEDEARALVSGGYASPVASAPVSAPAPVPAPESELPTVETATEDLGDTEEAVAPVAPTPRKRGRR